MHYTKNALLLFEINKINNNCKALLFLQGHVGWFYSNLKNSFMIKNQIKKGII